MIKSIWEDHIGYMQLHYFKHETLQISGSVLSPGTKLGRHLGTIDFTVSCIHLLHHHSWGGHGARHLQERRECAGPHTEGVHCPRRGRQPGGI